MSAPADAHGRSTARALRWTGALGIAAIALLRALTAFAPQVFFDLDPAIDPSPLAALGPAGSLWLDVLLVMACAAALLGESLAGRPLEWKLLLLAAIPAPVVLWHGWHDLGDLWRGSTWLAGAFALVATAHLARERIMRTVLIAALLALIGPLFVRGAAQVTIEHAATLAQFEQNKEQFLMQRGWEPDSPAAQIYERRLRQPQPVGWFATANIYASVMAAAFVLLLGCGVSLRGNRIMLMLVGAAGLLVLAALGMTGSKGAALVAGFAAMALLALLLPPLRRGRRRVATTLLIGLPALALLGVVARGLLLPEEFLHERSLLFRWHYLVSSFDIFRHAPVLGVGPDGYQQAYTMFRHPRNPEEVISAHSVFVDWLCMLGLAATTWIVLLVAMLVRAGRALQHEPQRGRTDDINQEMRLFAAGVTIFALIPAIAVEQHVLDGPHLALRVGGMGLYLILAIFFGRILPVMSDHALRVAAAVAAAALLMHGQIEMTFFQPGSVVWALCLVGIAGSRSATPSEVSLYKVRIQKRDWAASAALALVALWIALSAAWPAALQAARIANAAAALYEPADRAAERIAQRRSAAAQLVDAYQTLTSNVLPLHAAIAQLEKAAEEPIDPGARAQLLREAIDIADRAAAHGRSSTLGIRAGLYVRLALTTGEARHMEPAIDDLRRITKHDPHGIQSWRDLGHVLWLAGRRDEAARAYERALQNSAGSALDPLKQLPQAERDELRRRVEEGQR